MKVDYRIEGDVLIVSAVAEQKLDSDQDGSPSIEASSKNEIKLHGLEVFDELMKSSSLAQKIKEKLGV